MSSLLHARGPCVADLTQQCMVVHGGGLRPLLPAVRPHQQGCGVRHDGLHQAEDSKKSGSSQTAGFCGGHRLWLT